MNIFVGNLAKDVSEDELNQLFAEYGAIDSVKIIVDHFSGQSRGFGFVEMPNNEEAEAAIEGLNGHELNGQALTVNMAKPRAEWRGGGRDHGGGWGGGRSGGGRFGGGGFGGGKPGSKKGHRGDR